MPQMLFGKAQRWAEADPAAHPGYVLSEAFPTAHCQLSLYTGAGEFQGLGPDSSRMYA